MKKISGTLKIDQAQFRELEAFAKFGAVLDPVTTSIIEKGKRNVELLKQPQYSPLKVEEQAAVIYCGTKNLLSEVPVSKIKDFETAFLLLMNNKYLETLKALSRGELNADIEEKIKIAASDTVEQFKKDNG